MADFVKYQALGNDYLIVDRDTLPAAGATARLLCDRHLGIGADGVLFGPTRTDRPADPVRVQIFNADGSACARSANGLRMFALHLAQDRPGADRLVLRTAAGDSPVTVRDRAAGVVAIGMGVPSFDAADVPLLDHDGPALTVPLSVAGRTVTVTALHNGNPHAVVTTDTVSRELAEELGEPIAGHPRFPERTNVQFVEVLDRTALRIEIWERGAGYTLASGAGACAAVSAAHRRGLVDDVVRVQMPGGEVEVRLDDVGSVTLTGPVEQVAVGFFAPALRARLDRAGGDAR